MFFKHNSEKGTEEWSWDNSISIYYRIYVFVYMLKNVKHERKGKERKGRLKDLLLSRQVENGMKSIMI